MLCFARRRNKSRAAQKNDESGRCSQTELFGVHSDCPFLVISSKTAAIPTGPRYIKTFFFSTAGRTSALDPIQGATQAIFRSSDEKAHTVPVSEHISYLMAASGLSSDSQ
jgi:hypothetical protein